MRTLFEDVNEKADREDDGGTRILPLITWVIAAIMIVIAVGTYFWITRRASQPVDQVPVMVSVEDDAQVKKALNDFCGYIIAGNWEEAGKMLSSEARAGLEKEKKTLRESFMADRLAKKKADKVAQAFPMNIFHTATTARSDCAFIYADNEQTVRAITIIKEGERLVINTW